MRKRLFTPAGRILERCIRDLEALARSSYVPFASPAPCSTEVAVKENVSLARSALMRALSMHRLLPYGHNDIPARGVVTKDELIAALFDGTNDFENGGIFARDPETPLQEDLAMRFGLEINDGKLVADPVVAEGVNLDGIPDDATFFYIYGEHLYIPKKGWIKGLIRLINPHDEDVKDFIYLYLLID